MNTTPDRAHVDDEIDLFELWRALVRQRKLIVGIVLTVLLLAVIYVLTAQKIYQSEAEVALPNSSQIASLKSLSNTQDIDRESVYVEFLKNLQNQNTFQVLSNSKTLNQLLANAGYDFDSASELRVFLNDGKLKVAWPEQNKKVQLSVLQKTKLSMSLPSVQASQKALALVLEIANRQAVNALKQDLTSHLNEVLGINRFHYQLENQKINLEIESEIERIQEADALKREQIEQKIKALIDNSKENLDDQLQRLNENLRIAQKLGITEPIEPGQYGKTMQAKNTSNMIVDVNTQSGMKGYWMGTKILSAEINSLKRRQNLAAFIPQISALKADLLLLKQNPRVDQLKNRQSNLPYSERLRMLKIEKEKILHDLKALKAITFDTFLVLKSPSTPEAPVKPKGKLIIAVAIVLGLLLAVFVALIRSAALNHQEKRRFEEAKG
ncbi:lipopolysaccharide biosynthesis protein [Hydrogenovibrio crunogenus]|uniref:Lipopolysaccharide biosynthesis protein n=1 Tax=Hydrogenovibrio crunogenus TaxID=39765 RepID=A0A4P7P187_9GAMM|nr:Wzz/FepE/Etk N-terminal domain-containing protein [Hydrogenovibrio crunogenus]QBZ83857.1 lipopolysaccharide biosynthesis protein [Hydrogenovibrio crunogenus]